MPERVAPGDAIVIDRLRQFLQASRATAVGVRSGTTARPGRPAVADRRPSLGEEYDQGVEVLVWNGLVHQMARRDRRQPSIGQTIGKFGDVLLRDRARCSPQDGSVGAMIRARMSAHRGSESSISGRTGARVPPGVGRGMRGRQYPMAVVAIDRPPAVPAGRRVAAGTGRGCPATAAAAPSARNGWPRRCPPARAGRRRSPQ
jgi:hypothetical protein